MRAIAFLLLLLTASSGRLDAAEAEATNAAPARPKLNLWITSEDPFIYSVAKNTITYRKNVRAYDEKMTLQCEVLVGQRTSTERQKQRPKAAPKTNAPPAVATGTNAAARKPLMTPEQVTRLSYEFDWITADTNVVITIQDKNGKSIGTGAHAEYRAEKNVLVLTGAPYAITPDLVFTNYDTLVYDMLAETFTGIGPKGVTHTNVEGDKTSPADPKAPKDAVSPPPAPAPAPTPEPAPTPRPTTVVPVPTAAPTPTKPPVPASSTATNRAPANKLFSAPPPPLKPVP
jgi:hypothetical protein